MTTNKTIDIQLSYDNPYDDSTLINELKSQFPDYEIMNQEKLTISASKLNIIFSESEDYCNIQCEC